MACGYTLTAPFPNLWGGDCRTPSNAACHLFFGNAAFAAQLSHRLETETLVWAGTPQPKGTPPACLEGLSSGEAGSRLSKMLEVLCTSSKAT